jgi:hypothetical protein
VDGWLPTEVRRLLNINGAFGGAAGFLQGAPRDWAEQRHRVGRAERPAPHPAGL